MTIAGSSSGLAAEKAIVLASTTSVEASGLLAHIQPQFTVKTGITVLEAIEHVNQTLGTLTVLITHNAVIADMADRVIHLSDGHVIDIRENKNRRPVRSLAW